MNSNARFLLLPLLALIFLFQACSDDDGDEVSRKDLLIGSWEVQTGELTDYTITISGITLNKETISSTPFAAEAQMFEEALDSLADEIFPPNTIISFSEDNTYVLTNPNSQNSFQDSWALSSDEQNLTIEVENAEVSSLVLNIEELTANTLRVILTLDEDDITLVEEDEESGVQIDSFTIDYSFSFTK
ncbi:hypothetical protein [Catalinimonas niigatensis]|uniref:hypothetical protein n=1 Tax=Catalinimonas niigatensis TaxID=1397264 RepID=UPI002665A374|nr:hypothetical protein [Catalinimonas niigatensis]WPP53367.1 hypothetical protein PZB72_13390 [Catalinimonas niigatensis]